MQCSKSHARQQISHATTACSTTASGELSLKQTLHFGDSKDSMDSMDSMHSVHSVAPDHDLNGVIQRPNSLPHWGNTAEEDDEELEI